MTIGIRAARYILVGIAVAAMICLTSCRPEAPTGPGTGPTPGGGPEPVPVKWRIGFSQCTTTEPWRVLFNDLLEKEAAKHPEVALEILDAQDRTENQNSQMDAEIVGKETGITLIGEQDGDWKQIKGYSIMEAALKIEKDIDIVYAHNDPMAYGAYLAAEAAGREEGIKFVGIDANPDEGCKWAREEKLAATFVYPPPGEKGLQVALEILEGGEPEAQRIHLPTRRITKETVDEYLREKGML